MSKFPDLELCFDLNPYHFAVECKWREYFYKGCIMLDKFQLENYRHYQEVTGNPTFIIIGIGDKPIAPTQIYIVPSFRNHERKTSRI